MYELLKHPEAVEQIMSELSEIRGDITFSDFLRYDGAVNKLPYLEAAVREAIRLNPAASFTLSRKVPPVGCQLHQYHIPQGYIVGMVSYPVNYDTGYFGADVADFKPERWFGNHPTEMLDGEPRTMKNYLEAGWLSFGHGGRVCIGRHLAVFMMMKFFGRLLRAYEFELLRAPYEHYTLLSENLGMEVRIRRKAPAAVTSITA
jgi:cytochrome P450